MKNNKIIKSLSLLMLCMIFSAGLCLAETTSSWKGNLSDNGGSNGVFYVEIITDPPNSRIKILLQGDKEPYELPWNPKNAEFGDPPIGQMCPSCGTFEMPGIVPPTQMEYLGGGER